MLIARIATAIIMVLISCVILYAVIATANGMLYKPKPQSLVRMGALVPQQVL